jgi:hypothetical protein
LITSVNLNLVGSEPLTFQLTVSEHEKQHDRTAATWLTLGPGEERLVAGRFLHAADGRVLASFQLVPHTADRRLVLTGSTVSFGTLFDLILAGSVDLEIDTTVPGAARVRQRLAASDFRDWAYPNCS